MPQKSPGGKLGGINSGISRRNSANDNSAGDSKSRAKGKKRVGSLDLPAYIKPKKANIGNPFDADDEMHLDAITDINFTSFDPGDPGAIIQLLVTFQTPSSLAKLEVTVNTQGQPLRVYLKKMLTEAIRTKSFDPAAFGTWLSGNQARLSMGIGADMVPSLLSLRNHLQPSSVTNQKTSKTAVQNLLINVEQKATHCSPTIN